MNRENTQKTTGWSGFHLKKCITRIHQVTNRTPNPREYTDAKTRIKHQQLFFITQRHKMNLPGGWLTTEESILLPQSIWLNLEFQCYRTFVDAKSLC